MSNALLSFGGEMLPQNNHNFPGENLARPAGGYYDDPRVDCLVVASLTVQVEQGRPHRVNNAQTESAAFSPDHTIVLDPTETGAESSSPDHTDPSSDLSRDPEIIKSISKVINEVPMNRTHKLGSAARLISNMILPGQQPMWMGSSGRRRRERQRLQMEREEEQKKKKKNEEGDKKAKNRTRGRLTKLSED